MDTDSWARKTQIYIDQLKNGQFLYLVNKYAPFLLPFGQLKVSSTIGIDFQDNAIKLLKINNTKEPFQVENYAISVLPPGAIVHEEIKDPAVVIHALQELMVQSDVKTKEIAFAIPRSLAIIKTITIDSRLSGADIESRAWIEANRHFPELVGDIYLDFAILGPSSTDASQLEMILVACRKQQIKPYLDILKQVGLSAKVVDIDCYALQRAILPLIQSFASLESIVLFNLNVFLSTVIVMHQGNLIYAHNQSHDMQRLMSQIKQYIDEHGGDNTPEYQEILRNNLRTHLHHSIQLFYTSKPNISIQKILLSGDCATIPFLGNFIEEEFGVQAEVANPFLSMTFSDRVNVNEINEHASELMLCCGLALTK